MEGSEFGQWNAWIRFYFKEDAEAMDEETYYKRRAEIKFCLKALGKLGND